MKEPNNLSEAFKEIMLEINTVKVMIYSLAENAHGFSPDDIEKWENDCKEVALDAMKRQDLEEGSVESGS